ncbi:MAG: sigma-70 family RNA polymerase sigma factor [Clostridia bacterium]|nr:sigma-70 family RNA polymerase sigma factor [Clostridia bacterium]
MDIKNLPPRLSAEEEQKYFERFCKNGDIDARNKLIEHNLRMIVTVITERFLSFMPTFEFEDLFQEGANGLRRGIEMFDPSKNIKLSTFIYPYIDGYIRRYVTRYDLKMPRDAKVSIDSKPIKNDAEEEAFLIDFIADENDVQEEVIGEMNRKELLKQILLYLKEKLSAHAFAIFCDRFGVDDGKIKTYQDVAEKFGVSRERVRQICEKAKRLAREYLIRKGYAVRKDNGDIAEI